MTVKVSKNLIFSSNYLSSVVEELGAETPTITSYEDSVVRLFKNTITPTPSTPVADLEAAEADFTGYGAVTIAEPQTASPGLNFWGVMGNAIFTVAGGPPIEGNVIGGYWLETADGILIISESFAVPVTLSAFGHYLDLNVIVPFALTITLPDQT